MYILRATKSVIRAQNMECLLAFLESHRSGVSSKRKHHPQIRESNGIAVSGYTLQENDQKLTLNVKKRQGSSLERGSCF